MTLLRFEGWASVIEYVYTAKQREVRYMLTRRRLRLLGRVLPR